MLLQLPKRTAAIFAFIALSFSVIVPLSVPKAFSAPDANNLKAYQSKIDKVVSDFTAEIKKDGSYGYGVHNGRVYSPALDFIAPGFGEGREIDRLIEDSKYSIEDILGEGASGVGKSHSNVTPDGKTVSAGEFAIFSLTKTVDEAKLKEIITEELAKFLADGPKPGDTTKPGCKKAVVGDYTADIEKVVDKIENSRDPEFGTARIDIYNWDTAILRQINPAITEGLFMSDEQVKQAFGENTEWHLTATGPAQILDENGKPHSVGEGTVYFNVSGTYNYNREALLKIITDKVSEFLVKNPQEICENDDTRPGTTEPTTEPTKPGNDTKPGDNTKPGDDTQPGNDTKPGTTETTTEPTTPGNDNKPGNDTKPGSNSNPGDNSKPADADNPAVSDSKTGSSSATDSDNKPASGAATTTEGEQTVLEGATEAGGLATTGAVGLIALGVSVLLVGAGAALAIRRRK